MHGIRRQKYDEEVRRRKLINDVAKIDKYTTLSKQVLDSRDKKDYSEVAFKLTTQVLNLNPEFYTVWNYRRDILSNGLLPNCTEEARTKLYDSDLMFTMVQLKSFPKSYWVWHHRNWILKNDPAANYEKELMIVERLLALDSRNFHGWHYRRGIVKLIEQSTGKSRALKEFQYTTKLINSNFSNYSALHNRTKLIEQIFEQKDKLEADKESDKEILKIFESKLGFLIKELDYFKNAIYTDPNDQSVWLYLNWLLTSDLFREDKPAVEKVLVSFVNDIDELNSLEIEDNGIDNKWCLKIKSNIEVVLLKDYKLKTISSASGFKIDLANDVRQCVEKLKISDPKRVNRYIDIEKNVAIKGI